MRYILLALLLVLSPQVRSEIVYNGTLSTRGNNGSASSGTIWGETFTSATYVSRVSSISLYLAKGTGSGTISVSVYAVTPYTDGSTSGYVSTGTALSTSSSIDSSTLWSGAYVGEATFTNFTYYNLAANTRYAFQLNTSNLTGSISINAGVPNNSTTTGQNRYYSNNGGSSYSITGNYNTLSGFVNVTAVPEPATLILTGSALAAGAVGAFIKRRRKAFQEANAGDI